MHHVRVLVWLAVAAAVPAQTIWNVTAGANLTQAFAAAAPGDIVVLAPGNYPRFALTKGLTVLGPAVIDVVPAPGASNPSTVVVPLGQRARLIGLDFAAGQSNGHSLSVSGSVGLEDCSIGPGSTGGPALDAIGALVMQRCTVRSGGIWVAGGTASLSDCVLHGEPATVFSLASWSLPARPALHVAAGEVVCSSVTAVGGQGALGSISPPLPWEPPAPAVQASGAARLTLCDSMLTGGSFIIAGAPAVANTSSFAVRHARTTLTGTNGVPSVGNVVGDARLVGMRLDHGLRLGATSTATATAGVSQLLAILGGFDATPATFPGISGPVYGVAAGPAVLRVAVPGAGSTVASPIAVPNAAGLIGIEVWLQAVQFDGAASWSASPVVGGVVH